MQVYTVPWRMLSNLLQDLPDQFNPKVTGRVLIIDADTHAYRAAATSKRLKTAIRKFQISMLEAIFLTKAERARVHLTHSDCEKLGRPKVVGYKPYQANRKGTSKPPLLDELRAALVLEDHILPEYTAWLHMEIEADDACMIDSYNFADNGILLSEDKDLRMTPHTFYDPYTSKTVKAEGVGSVWLHTTDAGHSSLHGLGRLFFWAQMLMGDTADNIRGLDKYYGKNIGTLGTHEVLEAYNDTEDESAVAHLVLTAYMEHDQNPLPEAYMIHMLRSSGDTALRMLQELDHTPKVRAFLNSCYNRAWGREVLKQYEKIKTY